MKKIKVNDVDLAYRDEGAGEAIVFLHAFALTQRMWDEQVEAFATKCRVITFDWRGFGESTLGEQNTSMDVFADDLAGLLDALQIECATICGLSMGGYAAFAFYRKYGSRVASLILADTRAGNDTEEAKLARYKMAERVRREGLSFLPDEVLSKWLAPSTISNRPRVVEQVRSMIINNQPAGVVSAQTAMAERLDSTPLLAQIRCPTLVIVGEQDSLTPLSEAEKICTAIPAAHLKVINDSGHLSNIEQPEFFNQAIVAFLEARLSSQ